MSKKMDPHFFFSYCKADWNNDIYLERFLEDLKRRVAGLTPDVYEVDAVGFRDHDIPTGGDWKAEILAALQISKVLVCIYSPRFFSKDRTHEYCAKEFAFFLKRNPDTRYDPDDDGNLQIHGARNILPILWFSETDLTLHNFPPYMVRSVQYTINIKNEEIAERYKGKGLSYITRRRTPVYHEILDHFARQIILLSARPLPTLDSPPTIEKMWNAFWDPPVPHGGPPRTPTVAASPSISAASLLGPRDMIAIEVRSGSNGAPIWTPYAGGPGLAAAVGEIVYDRQFVVEHLKLDPGANEFVDEAWRVLANATSEQATPILFVDPRCFQIEAQRSAVKRLLQRQWRGGLIIPVDRSDKDTVRLFENIHSSLELSMIDRDWIVVRPSIGTMTDFRTSVISVADDVLARIVNHGVVQQKPPPHAGPDTRPRIANILDVKVSLS